MTTFEPHSASQARRLAACQVGHSAPTFQVTIGARKDEVFSPEAVQGLIGQRLAVTHPGVPGGTQTGVVTSARLQPDGSVDLEIETR